MKTPLRWRRWMLSAVPLVLAGAGGQPRAGTAPPGSHAYVLLLVDETGQLGGTAAAVEAEHLVERLRTKGLRFQSVPSTGNPATHCPSAGSCDLVEVRQFARTATDVQLRLTVSSISGPAPQGSHPKSKVRRCPIQAGDTVERCVEEQITPLEFWLKDIDIPLH